MLACCQESHGQVVDSVKEPKQHIRNAETKQTHLQGFLRGFHYPPFKDSARHGLNFINSYPMEEILETHPRLRDCILRAYLQEHLDFMKDNDVVLARNIYVRRVPAFEREVGLYMDRYGVPYNPMRPALSRTSVDVKQTLWWLLGLPE